MVGDGLVTVERVEVRSYPGTHPGSLGFFRCRRWRVGRAASVFGRGE